MILHHKQARAPSPAAALAPLAPASPAAAAPVPSTAPVTSMPPPAPGGVFAGAGWLALCKLGSQIFSWIGTFYVATRLLPSDYGLSNLSTAFTEFAVILTNLGIGTTLVQRQEVNNDKADTLFTATVGLGILLAAASFGLSYFGAWYFKNPDLVLLTQFTAVLYILSSITIVPYNFLNRDMRFKERGLLDMYSVIASISTQMILAFLGFGVWTLLWGSAVRFFMRLALAFAYSGYRPRLRFQWSLLKEDIGFSAQLTFNWFLSVVKDRSIPIIIGRAYSVSQLGLLGFAGSLSGIPNLKIVQLLREVLLPLLAKRAHDARAQLNGLATALKVMVLLILPIYLCGWYYGDATLACILPQKWAPMFPIFEVLCLVQMWSVLASIVSIYNTAQGKPIRSTWFELGLAIVVPAATYACRSLDLFHLAHLWSAIGAGVFLLWFAWQFHKEHAFLRRFAGQLLSMVLVCAALFCVDKLVTPFASIPMERSPMAWAALSARIALFLSGYGLYLRLAHWDFLKGLRRK